MGQVELLARGQPLVELVVERAQQGPHPGHPERGLRVHHVQRVLPERLDQVPQVHQVHCSGRRGKEGEECSLRESATVGTDSEETHGQSTGPPRSPKYPNSGIDCPKAQQRLLPCLKYCS